MLQAGAGGWASARGGGRLAVRGAGRTTWLSWSIDQQLQRDANLGMVEYQVLAMVDHCG